jgi:sialic acid synthase SpsE
MNRYKTDDIYIVAEIGQNHNGDLKIAKELIDDAYFAGCSAVKTAKRDLKYELSDKAYKRIYDSPNAFAKTYGEHREVLELSHEDHKFLKKYTNNRKMDYFLSVCDIPSLEFAIELDCPLIKIPSKEINNIPLLKEIAKYDKPVVFSIGLATKEEIEELVICLSSL